MGGINHQPTKNLFPFSTMLSQYFSGVIAELMHANYELEHALLAELDGAPPVRVAFLVRQARMNFKASIQFVAEAMTSLDLLAKCMAELDYADTSRSTITDLAELERSMIQNRLIPADSQSWNTISQVRREQAFCGVCRLFHDRFQDMLGEMKELEIAFDEIQEFAEIGRLTPAVDENQTSFRQNFFRTLTNLVETFVMFIHSAAMSTEMYYREEGFGSLLSDSSAMSKP